MELQGLLQIEQGLFFRLSLARHVNLEALSHEPIILLPDAGGKNSFHKLTTHVSFSGANVTPRAIVATDGGL